MKILYLIDQYKPEYYTGTIKFTENIVNNFSQNNKVKIVSYSDNCSSETKEIDGIKYWNETLDNIKCVKFTADDKYKTNYELYAEEVYNFALMIIKEFNPDIIHICHPRRVASFIQAAIDLNKKYIITFTDSFMICPNFFLFTNSCEICNGRHKDYMCKTECSFDEELIKVNRTIAAKYIDSAYALITPSKFQANIYEEYFNRKFHVINHGNKLSSTEVVDKQYPKEKLIFGFNGSSNVLKGLRVLVDAFNRIEDNIKVELHVHGNCDDTIKSLSKSKIKFFGGYKNNEVNNILSSIDILICPSIGYENYPFVITEAFINKVPVIATNESGIKELVKNCVNGFTFDLGDAEHLVQIIKFIFYNQHIISTLRTNLNNYRCQTIENEIEEYKEVYTKCFNCSQLDRKMISNVEKTWIDIISERYDSNITKYKKIIDEIFKKHNYTVNIDVKYKFIARLKNMERVLANEKSKSIIIWGTGTSSMLTIDILRNLYDWIKIDFLLDKYKKNGMLMDIPIVNTNMLANKQFDYLFVCTSPGKKEADELMKKLNKEINIDYSYGICVE